MFAKDLLLVPINHSNAHWCLCAIWPGARRIEHYDSLHATGAATRHALHTLRRYMEDEAADKRSGALGADGGGGAPWACTMQVEGVPRQRDGSACGVFTVSLAARLAAGARVPFSLAQADVPALRMRIAADCLAGCVSELAPDE